MRLIVPIALAASLAACSAQYDPDRCSASELASDHLSSDANECVSQWAIRLAKGPDSAHDIAEGAAYVCRKEIGGSVEEADADDPTSGTTIQQAYGDARRKAVFRVVEERAGHCSEKK